MTTAMERILSTPLKAMERGGVSSVLIVADGYRVATIGSGMNDRPEYARLFAAAPILLAALKRIRTAVDFYGLDDFSGTTTIELAAIDVAIAAAEDGVS